MPPVLFANKVREDADGSLRVGLTVETYGVTAKRLHQVKGLDHVHMRKVVDRVILDPKAYGAQYATRPAPAPISHTALPCCPNCRVTIQPV